MRRTFLAATTCMFSLLPFAAQALGIQVLVDGMVIVFKDVPQSAWYAEYVRAAAEAEIVSGYEDEQGNLTGEYGPSNRITLAETLKIAIEGAGYDVGAYSAVISSGVGDHWASPYVSVAKAEGFIIFDNTVRLDSPATRAEVASIFTSAFRLNTDVDVTMRYTDVTIATDYATSIEALSRAEIVAGDTDKSGDPTGMYRPNDAINRAEVAKIVMESRATVGLAGEGRKLSTNDPNVDEHVVIYSSSGFEPKVLRIKLGDSVQFHNQGTAGMWVASDSHPTHSDYPGFDAKENFGQGETYSYTFTRVGVWGYHNHLNSSHLATIIVEEE